jgi:uncharacterized protein YhaN
MKRLSVKTMASVLLLAAAGLAQTQATQAAINAANREIASIEREINQEDAQFNEGLISRSQYRKDLQQLQARLDAGLYRLNHPEDADRPAIQVTEIPAPTQTIKHLHVTYAILKNGFIMRNVKHEVIGAVTRLYMSNDAFNFVDILTTDIDHFESRKKVEGKH